MSKISIRILDIKNIRNQISTEVLKNLTPILNQAFENIKTKISDIFIDTLQDTEIWRSLKGSQKGNPDFDLQAQLGLEDNSSLVTTAEQEILDKISNILNVTNLSQASGGAVNNRSRKIQFNIVFSDIENAIKSISSSSYESNGGTVDWINLLLDGGNVDGYTIIFGVNLKGSRTGRALMVETNNYDYTIVAHGSTLIGQVLENTNFLKKIQEVYEKELLRLV